MVYHNFRQLWLVSEVSDIIIIAYILLARETIKTVCPPAHSQAEPLYQPPLDWQSSASMACSFHSSIWQHPPCTVVGGMCVCKLFISFYIYIINHPKVVYRMIYVIYVHMVNENIAIFRSNRHPPSYWATHLPSWSAVGPIKVTSTSFRPSSFFQRCLFPEGKM